MTATTLTNKMTKIIIPSDNAFIMRINGFVTAGPLSGSPVSL